MPKREQSEAQRTNELLEKLLVVQLREQGVGQDQIAKFLGKRKQSITEILKLLKSAGKETNASSNRK